MSGLHVQGHGGEVVATFREQWDGRSDSHRARGSRAVSAFPLGRSYFSSLHQGLRDNPQVRPSLAPDIHITGVPIEYRLLVEARWCGESKGQPFICDEPVGLRLADRSAPAWLPGGGCQTAGLWRCAPDAASVNR